MEMSPSVMPAGLNPSRTMAKKKKSKAPPTFDQVMASIQATTDGVSFLPASEVATSYSLRRKFGIPKLDIGLRGGLPAGTLSQLFGPDGIGKDYLANKAIANVQNAYQEEAAVFIASFGYKMDRGAMYLAGVQMPGVPGEFNGQYDHLMNQVGQLVTLEVDDSTTSKFPAEAVLEGVLACVRSGRFQLGIINELPAAETSFHKRVSLLESARHASLASLIADFQRKFYNAMKAIPNNETTVLVINQVRANMNAQGPYSKKTSETGGFALKHLKAADIHLRHAGKIKNKKGDVVLGKEVAWQISKGKCGLSEGAEGSYDFLYYRGADILKDLIDLGQEYGIVTRAGPYYYIGDLKFLGLDKFKEYLQQDDNALAIEQAVYAAAELGHVRYT